VRAVDRRWIREIERARETVLAKMQHILGAEAVRTLRTRH
jgi:hypothetical protein